MREQPQLAQMLNGQAFDGYLLVRSAVQRSSQSGSKYLDMTLCDISGEVNAKMWDGFTPPPEAGQPIRVKGVMQEYNSKPQLRVDKLRAVNETDDIDMSVLVPVAPYPAEKMLDYINARIERMADESLKTLVKARLDSYGERILYYPAATRLHHAERAGLLHHTSTMLRSAEALCKIYDTLDSDLLAAGIIIHDLCKMTEIASDELGIASDYTREGQLIGHLVKGVAELDRLGRELGVSEELLQMLEHMVLSHHDLPEFGSPKPPMFPEAEVLHILDLLDARMFEMNNALAAVQPGSFTDRIWSMDNRRLYRRKIPGVKTE